MDAFFEDMPSGNIVISFIKHVASQVAVDFFGSNPDPDLNITIQRFSNAVVSTCRLDILADTIGICCHLSRSTNHLFSCV